MNDFDTNSEGVENIEQETVDIAESVRMELHDWLQCIVLAVVCGIFIFVFVGRTIGVKGESMLPTFHPNDRVIMTNLFYTPRNGDVVIFHTHGADFPYVKRVIAVAGQTVDIDFVRGVVYVDGVALYEPYILEPTTRASHFYAPITVEEGTVFVLGDNRNNSTDSRDVSIGLVDTRQILGRVLFIIVPGGDSRTPRDWSRIGLVRN